MAGGFAGTGWWGLTVQQRLARRWVVVTTPPQAVAARQYFRGGTLIQWGGVLFYQVHPAGYVAIFRHYNET